MRLKVWGWTFTFLYLLNILKTVLKLVSAHHSYTSSCKGNHCLLFSVTWWRIVVLFHIVLLILSHVLPPAGWRSIVCVMSSHSCRQSSCWSKLSWVGSLAEVSWENLPSDIENWVWWFYLVTENTLLAINGKLMLLISLLIMLNCTDHFMMSFQSYGGCWFVLVQISGWFCKCFLDDLVSLRSESHMETFTSLIG